MRSRGLPDARHPLPAPIRVNMQRSSCVSAAPGGEPSRPSAEAANRWLSAATDDGGAADLDPQPLAQPFGRLLTAALLRDQPLDPLLDAVVAQAGRAFFEMVLELVPSLGRALAVEQRPYLRDHRRAFLVLGIDASDRRGPTPCLVTVAHDDTSSGASSCRSPRMKPRSLATSANRV